MDTNFCVHTFFVYLLSCLIVELFNWFVKAYLLPNSRHVERSEA